MLEITQNASNRLSEVIAERKGEGLRLFVEKGGCAGLQYVLSVDSRRSNDHVFPCAGGQVFIDPESFLYLDGSTLEYEEGNGLNDIGFRIQNPKANRSCGCGTSFEYNTPANGG
ncbi:MAG: iron-sulfur cluster assembly accessory protein [Verrucomicrobia bacterium]|nr:MAG: iron-sulfur cluster assembly accessory protein [Verrucomicrobiota bacterium]